MEAASHHSIAQGVRKCHERHSLMVRHKSTHDLDIHAFWKPAARIVERFVETVGSQAACARESCKVFHRRRRIDHCCERSGGRRDYDILAEATLESEPRHSKTRVLVREIDIARIVGGL